MSSTSRRRARHPRQTTLRTRSLKNKQRRRRQTRKLQPETSKCERESHVRRATPHSTRGTRQGHGTQSRPQHPRTGRRIVDLWSRCAQRAIQRATKEEALSQVRRRRRRRRKHWRRNTKMTQAQKSILCKFCLRRWYESSSSVRAQRTSQGQLASAKHGRRLHVTKTCGEAWRASASPRA